MPSVPVAESLAGEPSAEPSRTSQASASDQAVSAPRITWSEQEFDGRVVDAMGDRSQFVAVGSSTNGTAAWTSDDGVLWQEHEVPERSFGEIDEGVELTAGMGTLVRLGDTLYSFGGMSFMDAVTGAGWRWTDGEAWQVIRSESPFFGGRVEAAAANDDALVAAVLSFAGGLYGSFTTWQWTPEASWTRTQLAPSDERDIRVGAIAWQDSTFLAAGSSADAVPGAERWEWPHTLAMWTSADGTEWGSVEITAGMSKLCDVAPTPRGFVAFGASGDGLTSWTSGDGLSWTQGTVEPVDVGVAIGDMSFDTCRIVEFDGGLAAFARGGLESTLLWTSRDGGSWTFQERLPLFVNAVAALDRQVLVFGSDPGSDDGSRLLVGTVSDSTSAE